MIQSHLEKLFYFFALAEEKSFVLAAQKLNISQPALSKTIKVIEDVFQGDLVIRSKSGIELTEKGTILYRFIAKLAAELPDIEKQILELDTLSGQLRIGTFETLGISFWPKFLQQLAKHAPNLSLSLATSNPENHWSKLESGELHLILDAEPRLKESYFSKLIYKDKFALFKSHSGENQPNLSSLCYVKRAYDQKGKTIKQSLMEMGINHELMYDLDSFTAVKEIVVAGISVGVLPLALAAPDIDQGLIEQIPNTEFGNHRICATCLESRRKDKRINYLMGALQQFSALGAIKFKK